MRNHGWLLPLFVVLFASPALADTILFSTGNVDGRMAAATRPSTPGKFEIETADDFVLTSESLISGATFTGLVSGGGTIGQVTVEIYRVFPNDSNVGRTSGAPTFSTPNVPTRVNSPSDVEFVGRSTTTSNLSFSTTALVNGFTAANSVKPGGIHPSPNQTTGGDGPVTGQEVLFNVTFTTPLDLPADHYFFVPQVELVDPASNFYWLSAPRPIVPPGTPFPAGFTDLQAWTRDQFIDPDWLRIGTDIVGGTTPPTFNMAFSLTGSAAAVPEPSSLCLLLFGGAMIGGLAIATITTPALRATPPEAVEKKPRPCIG